MNRFATAILLGLAVAGPAAAQGAGADAGLAAQFHRLDRNGDGVLSRSEASADPQVADLYQSLDTNSTIEDNAKNAQPGGITLGQFESGMQAKQHGGTVGPAASGGETYKVYPDGSKEKVQGTGIQTK